MTFGWRSEAINSISDLMSFDTPPQTSKSGHRLIQNTPGGVLSLSAGGAHLIPDVVLRQVLHATWPPGWLSRSELLRSPGR